MRYGESGGLRGFECLQMALIRLEGMKDICLIHHSDRGVQYASHAYVDMLHGMESGGTGTSDTLHMGHSTSNISLLGVSVFGKVELWLLAFKESLHAEVRDYFLACLLLKGFTRYSGY